MADAAWEHLDPVAQEMLEASRARVGAALRGRVWTSRWGFALGLVLAAVALAAWAPAHRPLEPLAFVFLVGGVALRARRQPVVTGAEELIGSVGVVLEDADGEAWARVRSEQWRVQSRVPLKRGQDVRVTGRNGLVLTVTPLNEGAGG